jgi:hypothetical protein
MEMRGRIQIFASLAELALSVFATVNPCHLEDEPLIRTERGVLGLPQKRTIPVILFCGEQVGAGDTWVLLQRTMMLHL